MAREPDEVIVTSDARSTLRPQEILLDVQKEIEKALAAQSGPVLPMLALGFAGGVVGATLFGRGSIVALAVAGGLTVWAMNELGNKSVSAPSTPTKQTPSKPPLSGYYVWGT